MIKIVHKILSFSMALVVLISTMSFTINAHYCGGTLVASSMFNGTESCGMEQAMATLPSGCSMTKVECCKNEQSIVKGQDELKLNFDKLSSDSQVFVAVFLHTYNTLFETKEEATSASTIFPPPNIVRHIYKLDESYLI
ncbi:MAG: HYC_CC_PP family protein [Aquaticitalea sp.]